MKKPKKPAKPYKDFPLFPHATRRWAKKIKGRTCYFGPWDDPDGALKRYLEEKDDLYAGRTPGIKSETVKLKYLANRFLTAKMRKLETGELKKYTFDTYYRRIEQTVTILGKRRLVDDLVADDFGRLRSELAKSCGPQQLALRVQLVRSMFKFGYESEILEKTVRFGPEFKGPARRILRKERQSRPQQMFEPDEIRAMLAKATVPMRGMILLSINGALGNSDISGLSISAIDLKGGMLDYPRPKTAIERRVPLWPETVTAIRQVMAARPDPADKEDEGLLFITRYGKRWVRYNPDPCGGHNGVLCDTAGVLFSRTKKEGAGITRAGTSFYSLRRTFRTVADEVSDRPAIDRIMGHENGADMAVHYCIKLRTSGYGG